MICVIFMGLLPLCPTMSVTGGRLRKLRAGFEIVAEYGCIPPFRSLPLPQRNTIAICAQIADD